MGLAKSIYIVVLSLVITFILLFVSFYLGWPQLINVIIMDAFLLFIFTYIIFMAFSNTIRRPKKYSSEESLFQWAEDLSDYDDFIMNTFKGKKAKYKTIDNLKVSKRLVMSLTKRNKETLKLYKAFYAMRYKESTEDLYLKTVLVIMPSIGLYFIRDYIPQVASSGANTLILITAFLFITVAAITDRLNHNKKRIGLLIELIEICLEEIEEKEKGKKE